MKIDVKTLHAQLKTQSPDLFEGVEAALISDIISKAVSLIGMDGVLDHTKAQALLTAIRRSLKPGKRRRAFNQVTLVLQAINATGLATCMMPRQTYRPVRPQTLASSETRFDQQASVYAMEQSLDAWRSSRDGSEPMDAVLALAMRLVTRTGMGADLVSGSLARLTPASITANGLLLLPVDVADFAEAVYRWPLPKGCWSLLPGRTNNAPSPNDELLFPEALGPPIDMALPEEARIAAAYRKQKAVTESLQSAFRAFAKDFARHHARAKGARVESWATFCAVGRLIPQGRGIPPALITLGKGFPLPGCADLAALNDRTSHLQSSNGASEPPELSVEPVEPEASDLALTAPAGGEIFDTAALPPDWAARARLILKRFCGDAEALCGKNGYITERNHDQLKARYQQHLRDATRLWSAPSLLHVGLGWLYELAGNRAKASTLKTYLSRLFAIETFLLEPAMDLRLWDDDTVAEMTESIIASRAWQRNTEGHFLQTWGDFLRYAQRIDVLRDVERLPARRARVHSAKRVDILTPYEAGFIWKHCQQASGEWGEQAAAAVMLGFYGGLRASEAMSLTLKDVLIDHGEVQLTISQGKTAAARRSIRLDALTPPKMVEAFTELVEARRQQFADPRFEGWKINQIALFGPRDNPDRYTRQALIDPIISLMREHLGGEVDFHLLRHSFVSWLILRVHAMRHPGFAEILPQKAATMFQPDALARLRQLFDGETHSGAGTDDHIQIKKLVGHEDLRTSILHYTHTLDWIHADIMRRAYNEGPRVKVG